MAKEIDTTLVEIDINALDNECREHSKRMMEWVDRVAVLRDKVARAKAHMEKVAAEQRNFARSNPEAAGIKSSANEPVKDYAETCPEFQEAQTAYFDVKLRLDRADGRVSALEHRKKQLESLVYLFGAGYFAAPQIKGHGKKAAEQTSKANRGRGVKD